MEVLQNNNKLFERDQIARDIKKLHRKRMRKNAPFIQLKKEADSCGIKLSDVGRAMLKEYLDVNAEEYSISFKRYEPGVGGLL